MFVEVNEIKCFNVKDNLINVIKIKFKKYLNDIVVIVEGCLLYSDWKLCIVNKVVNG